MNILCVTLYTNSVASLPLCLSSSLPLLDRSGPPDDLVGATPRGRVRDRLERLLCSHCTVR